MWWRDAVVYQVYPRSFQDSDGDGVGDLRGIERRLDHLSWLGVDAVWLSPIYPSPLADMGYDVSDFTGIDPVYGTHDDFDSLREAAHRRGIRLVMDLVPCHTSIEHPWFRDHPERYIWSGRDGPRNNWLATFGGSAWTPDPMNRGWYMHSFYPDQPDLDWRNPEVARALGEVVRFWLGRGADGFRVDALDRLVKDAEFRDDPPAREPFPLPLPAEYAQLEHRYSVNSPDIHAAVAKLRAAAGEHVLIGEVYLPAAQVVPYLQSVDLAFCFELLHAGWERQRLREAVDAGLSLQRDGARHPMQWDATPSGGFTDGDPWLTAVDPGVRNVASQHDDESSLLRLYRDLIGLRRTLGPGLELIDSEGGVLAYRRGGHLVAINLTPEERPAPSHGEVVLATHEHVGGLAPHAAIVAAAD